MAERKIIITGGAGYLGRCAVEFFQSTGFSPIILDNFCTSSRQSVQGLSFIEVDLADSSATENAFEKIGHAEAIIHFAAKALVGESVLKPAEYFRNNVQSSINLAEMAVKHHIPAIIHSSSCSVYGFPAAPPPIGEQCPFAPLSPYATSKMMAESVFHQYALHRNLRVANLRYFNPAGSWRGKYGEGHEPETHLIPCLVEAIANDKPFKVFGTDYPTPDGSAIRDLIHVEDLILAHGQALKFIQGDKWAAGKPLNLNLGTGRGTSVLQAIQAAEKVMGKKAKVVHSPRRAGDAASLFADVSLALQILDWKPTRTLDQMIQDHWTWSKNNHFSQ